MTAIAHIKDTPFSRGVEVYLLIEPTRPGDLGAVVSFEQSVVARGEAGTEPAASPLRLEQDMARALYEALADHFGHAGHDIRALRKDYDAERARVDKFIEKFLR